MENGNYEQLVDQITDLVLAKLGGDEYCPTFCRADVERIVDAGAERIGIVLAIDRHRSRLGVADRPYIIKARGQPG